MAVACVLLTAPVPTLAQDLALGATAGPSASTPAAAAGASARHAVSDALDEAPAYYVVRGAAEMRAAPSLSAPILETLRVRDGVRVLPDAATDGGPWRLVHANGRRGYVASSAISNVWIRVSKSERTLYVFRGADLIRTLPADVSVGTGDKVRRARLDEQDQWRVPEGTFFVTRRNPNSQYYRAFVISYPSPQHALRGVESGIITEAEYQTIMRAHAEGREPPQGTRLGGLIEIHGAGSGRRTAWTRGCVALRNVHMDDLWEIVDVGTPVVIEP